MPVSFSGSDGEFEDRVRNMLGDISSSFIKDENIQEQRDTIVEPFIDRHVDAADHDQSDLDNAIVAYTAYRAFVSVPIASTVSGGGLTANLAPAQYRAELKQMASMALESIGLSVPEVDSPAPFVKRTDGMLR